MTTLDVLPRVLVVGQPFERTTGGGITLSNLFSGWPADRLRSAEVAGAEPTFDVCARRYLLGRDEIAWVWPLSAVARTETRASGPLERTPGTGTLRTVVGTGTQIADPRSAPSLLRSLFHSAVDASGLEHVLRRTRLSPALARWISDYRPEVVYSQLSDLPVMSLVEEVLDATGAAFVLHVMDDWPTTMYRRGALSVVPRRHAEAVFRRLLARAQSRLAIGDAMAAEYERRYGAGFVGMQNPTDLSERDALAARHAAEFPRDPSGAVTVLYAGRVGTANEASLGLVAQAVAAMVAEGAPLVLRIRTSDIGHPAVATMRGLPGVEVLPSVPYDRVPALLESADILLLPLDFGARAMRFASLSMPTKIPEYLAASRAVLTVAPRTSAAGDYAATGEWSLLVDDPTIGAVRDALQRLTVDPALRASMGRAGRLVARRDHDAGAVRERFAEELRRAASAAQR